MTPAALLHFARSLGMAVGADWAYTRVCFVDPADHMTPELFAALCAVKPELLVLLRAEGTRDPAVVAVLAREADAH